MKKDFQVFKEIRIIANSGLYKYRTKERIDSIYNWADQQIKNSTAYLNFYNIICRLTDYEDSLHNDTSLLKKYSNRLKEENGGFFPYPIKWIDGKWLINYKNTEIPLSSEISSINGIPKSEIIKIYTNTTPPTGKISQGKEFE